MKKFAPTFKLTALRSDILAILQSSKKPLGAYDILNKLKKKRPGAEPPTVYRVLDYLQQVRLVHRIESQNLYVSCEHQHESAHQHKAVLLFCVDCHHSLEFPDAALARALLNFAKKHAVKIDDSLIEIKGHCPTCAA